MPADEPLTNLHCFHHAGGDARAFRRWGSLLTGVRVLAAVVEVGDGAAQPDVESLVAQWATQVDDTSGVYYGHSMGALVAFEAAARVLAEQPPARRPAALVLGAPPAAGSTPRLVPERHGSRAAQVRRGIERVRRYRPPQAALPVPVHVVRGELDQVVPEPDARAWADRGGPGSRWHALARAGHQFHLAPGEDLLRIVREVVSSSSEQGGDQ